MEEKKLPAGQRETMERTDIVFRNVTFGYGEKKVVKHLSLQLEAGKTYALVGASGSGKSTLMNIIGCLDKPTSGTYVLNGKNILDYKDKDMADIRLHEIGFVFQNFQLLPGQNALNNVLLPLQYAKVPKKERKSIATKALERVGLGDRLTHKPNQLSGGQCQRVAIARAMVNNPSILLADEPTGALDSKSGEQIMDLFKELNEEGVTIVMITHEPDIAAHAKRIIHIKDGEVIE